MFIISRYRNVNSAIKMGVKTYTTWPMILLYTFPIVLEQLPQDKTCSSVYLTQLFPPVRRGCQSENREPVSGTLGHCFLYQLRNKSNAKLDNYVNTKEILQRLLLFQNIIM